VVEDWDEKERQWKMKEDELVATIEALKRVGVQSTSSGPI
jgi:hypothetical protein